MEKEKILNPKKYLDKRIVGLLMAVASPLSIWCGISLANHDYVTGLLILGTLSFLEYYITINWIEQTKS